MKKIYPQNVRIKLLMILLIIGCVGETCAQEQDSIAYKKLETIIIDGEFGLQMAGQWM